MAGLLPAPTLKGVADYLFLAGGIIIGFLVLSAPMTAIQDNLKKGA